MADEEQIVKRKKEGLIIAGKIAKYLVRAGIPTEYGFRKSVAGHTFDYDMINSTVSVEVGGDKQLYANIDKKVLTVYRGRTWANLLSDMESVLEKDETSNLAYFKLKKFLDVNS